MPAKVSKLEDDQGWMIECPACGCGHRFDSRWAFNGNTERPTFTPSMHVTTGPRPRFPRFPIHIGELRGRETPYVSEIPWELIEPHEAQALANHDRQTLKRLAQRGGLSYSEALAILTDQRWCESLIEGAETKVGKLIQDWYDSAPNNVCHSFVTDGRIQFLGDCTHAMAGQTVDLPDWEDS